MAVPISADDLAKKKATLRLCELLALQKRLSISLAVMITMFLYLEVI